MNYASKQQEQILHNKMPETTARRKQAVEFSYNANVDEATNINDSGDDQDNT